MSNQLILVHQESKIHLIKLGYYYSVTVSCQTVCTEKRPIQEIGASNTSFLHSCDFSSCNNLSQNQFIMEMYFSKGKSKSSATSMALSGSTSHFNATHWRLHSVSGLKLQDVF